MNTELRVEIQTQMTAADGAVRFVQVLNQIGIPKSNWYRKPGETLKPKAKPGPMISNIEPELVDVVVGMALEFPWYGYKRIAVMCRRCGFEVSNRQAYRIMKKKKLLQQRRSRDADVYQARKLFELLPQRPNQLWQTDVTYIHIPGHGWHYAVTVIDYYSRYLLAVHLTSSYSALQCTIAIEKAKVEAKRLGYDGEEPVFLVTDNGSSFLARRFTKFLDQERFSHVRIQYRTPQQLGLLERFHQTLKTEEVYWNLYQSVDHAAESLEQFRERYNMDRPHWALRPTAGGDPLVPYEIYALKREIQIPEWQGWAKAAKQKIDEMIANQDQVA